MSREDNGTSEGDLADLPVGWCWTTLARIADINGGITKDQKRSRTPTMREVPYLRVANVQRSYLDLHEIKTIFAEDEDIAAMRLRKGDVLFTEGGDRDKLGRGWVWNDEIEECIHQNHIFRARLCLPLVEPKFVSYHGNFFGQQWFTATGKQTTNLASINKGVLSRFPVPLAPLNEQSRIVAKIEELFSDLDAGVAALKRIKANLKRYRAAVLKAAVEGKLTEEWRAKHPKTEPASKLLERILTERRKKWEEDQLAKFAAAEKEPPKGWQEKYVEPMPPDTTDLPELPEGWAVASIDQLTTTITSGSRDWTQYYGSGTGTFIMAQNVRKGLLNLEYRQSVHPPPNDRDSVRSQVACNDLLVTIVGANTGDVCRVPSDLPEHYVCQSVALMRPVVGDVAEYLEAYFVADHGGQKHFRRYIYGQGRPHLGFDELRMTPVVLPPISEQKQVTAEVEARLSVITSAEQQINASVKRAARLRQSILKRAFEGKLVPQDPTDEPADKLLERIQKERTA
jgi:type I restriction enzyme S subunit